MDRRTFVQAELEAARASLGSVLEYADTVGELAFEDYPRALPELGELVAGLAGVRLADVELEAGRREALRVPALEAWEIDAGPAGVYWELGTVNDAGGIVARPGNVANRAEAEAAGAVVFHTVAEYEAEAAELEAGRDGFINPARVSMSGADMVTGIDREPVGDRMAELEVRVARLERLAEDERTGKAER